MTVDPDPIAERSRTVSHSDLKGPNRTQTVGAVAELDEWLEQKLKD